MTADMTSDVRARATSTAMLEQRLATNARRSSVDLQQWLFDRLAVQPDARILDVGCGSGVQTLEFARRVGSGGVVCAVDVSPDSIETLKQRVQPGMRVKAVVGDMDELETIIRRDFQENVFDLAHSSYALYYARHPVVVLDIMHASLAHGGRLAVVAPNQPHGLVELMRRFTAIPGKVDESLRFGPDVLTPYFTEHLDDVTVHELHNEISVPTVDEAVAFYRATTYYDVAAEGALAEVARAAITNEGAFRYEKHAFLVIGTRRSA